MDRGRERGREWIERVDSVTGRKSHGREESYFGKLLTRENTLGKSCAKSVMTELILILDLDTNLYWIQEMISK